MEMPCINFDKWPYWLIALMAVLTWMRQTVLVVREVVLFLGEKQQRARRLKRGRKH